MSQPVVPVVFPQRLSTGRLRGRAASLGLAWLTAALAFAGLALTSPDAFAATGTVTQCNNIGPSAAGATTTMTCTVTVVNTISGAHRGSTTTVTRACSLGPCPPGNGTFVSHSTSLVTSVNQCNGSDNDSAHPITCRVTITNNISAGTPGATTVTAATVNECVGSATGGGGSLICSPNPASVTGATVTQCNGSGNGGGGTVNCSVASASRVSPAIQVKVNQCNGTGNPGGSVVTCQTRITTNITAAVPTTTTTTTTGQVTRIPTGGVAAGDGSTAGLLRAGWLTAGVVLLLVAATGAVLRRRFPVGSERSRP